MRAVFGGAIVASLSILATPGSSVQAVDYDFVSVYSSATTLAELNATAPSVTLSPRVLAGYGERLESVRKEHPAQRLAEPEEQAAAIVFLCSPEASYINGACIDVTGGAVNI